MAIFIVGTRLAYIYIYMKSDQDPNNFEEIITMSSRYLLDNKIRKLVEYLKKKCSTCLIIGYRVQMFNGFKEKLHVHSDKCHE